MYIFPYDITGPHWVNTLRQRQNDRHFADDTFNRIFMNENVRILIKFSLKLVPRGPVNNIPALVQIMAWRHPGGTPLSEPVMGSLLTHICVTRPQWVKMPCLSHAIWHGAYLKIYCSGQFPVESIEFHLHLISVHQLMWGSIILINKRLRNLISGNYIWLEANPYVQFVSCLYGESGWLIITCLMMPGFVNPLSAGDAYMHHWG